MNSKEYQEQLGEDLKFFEDKKNKVFEKLLVIMEESQRDNLSIENHVSYQYLSSLHRIYSDITCKIYKELRSEEKSEELRKDTRELSKQLQEETDYYSEAEDE